MPGAPLMTTTGDFSAIRAGDRIAQAQPADAVRHADGAEPVDAGIGIGRVAGVDLAGADDADRAVLEHAVELQHEVAGNAEHVADADPCRRWIRYRRSSGGGGASTSVSGEVSSWRFSRTNVERAVRSEQARSRALQLQAGVPAIAPTPGEEGHGRRARARGERPAVDRHGTAGHTSSIRADERPRAARPPLRLRPRPVRRVLGARRRRGNAVVHHAHRGGRRQIRDDARRAARVLRAAA